MAVSLLGGLAELQNTPLRPTKHLLNILKELCLIHQLISARTFCSHGLHGCAGWLYSRIDVGNADNCLNYWAMSLPAAP